MATVPLASVADLADALGLDDFGDEETRAAAILARVSAKARHEARRTWLDETGALTTVPDEVWSIVIEASIRAYSVTPGVYQETTGPTSVMWDRSAQQGTFFTADEVRVLRSFRAGVRPGLTSVKVTGLPWPDAIVTDLIAVVGVDGVSQAPLPSGGRWT